MKYLIIELKRYYHIILCVFGVHFYNNCGAFVESSVNDYTAKACKYCNRIKITFINE